MTEKKIPLLVYVAGPYRAPHAFGREENIFEARRVGAMLVADGFMPVIPHANTAHFDGLASDEFFLEGTLEMMRRCDAVLLIPSWEKSSGARAEKAEAEELGIPVVDNLQDLRKLEADLAADEAQFEAQMDAAITTVMVALGEPFEVFERDLNDNTDA